MLVPGICVAYSLLSTCIETYWHLMSQFKICFVSTTFICSFSLSHASSLEGFPSIRYWSLYLFSSMLQSINKCTSSLLCCLSYTVCTRNWIDFVTIDSFMQLETWQLNFLIGRDYIGYSFLSIYRFKYANKFKSIYILNDVFNDHNVISTPIVREKNASTRLALIH